MNNRIAILTLAFALSAIPCFAQDNGIMTTEEQTTDQRDAERQQATRDEEGEARPEAEVSRRGQDTQEGPVYLEEYIEEEERGAQEREPAAGERARTEAEEPARAQSTQLSFFELTPALGAMSINDKAAFSIGVLMPFRIIEDAPVFFEPSVLASFLSGQADRNVTLFHVDAGVRLDWVIGDSPLVPFVKGAIGPTLASNNETVVNNETVSDSYFNAFLGGGLKLLVNPNIGARFDTGVTFQGTDPGLYVLGAATIPL